jgi:hypothetical protein
VIGPIDPTNRWLVIWTGRLLFAFAAGFVAVLAFHQPMLALLHNVGLTPLTAYPMQPTSPFGIPRVLSLALWGGVWALALAVVLARLPTKACWPAALVFGALGPSLVNWLVVLPLKGAPVGGGWHPSGIATALIINAAWGLGTALLWLLATGRFRRQTRGAAAGA